MELKPMKTPEKLNNHSKHKMLTRITKTRDFNIKRVSISFPSEAGINGAMARLPRLLMILVLVQTIGTAFSDELQSPKLCSQCSACTASQCPPSEAYPHMTAWDNSLIAGALQSDFVPIHDRGVYAVPNIKGGSSDEYSSYFGWQSTSGSASGFHRFSNYMDKCSHGQTYLAVIGKAGTVGLRSLSSLESPAQADWKTLNPPKKLDHQGLRFWMNRSTGKCLTVLNMGSKQKRAVGVAECKLDGSNPFQLFAFRFHYHKAFCCCNLFIQ